MVIAEQFKISTLVMVYSKIMHNNMRKVIIIKSRFLMFGAIPIPKNMVNCTYPLIRKV